MNSRMDVPYYLPPGTAQAVQRHIRDCMNLSLILGKYVRRTAIDESENKMPWLRELLGRQIVDNELAQRAYQRWRKMMDSIGATLFEAQLDWRMVVGLGGESVLETDITLHHLYGLPYIPGSALKGLTRAYVSAEEEKYFITPESKPEAGPIPSLEEKTDHPVVKRILGTQQDAGTVLFFDAFPKDGQATFVLDIMNPHYPKYYNSLQSKSIKEPTNDQSPNLIPFLTVHKTTFTFALAPRNPSNAEHKDDVGLVEGWLRKALQRYGVGGKTSAGYGYFQEPHGLSSSTATSASGESVQALPVDPEVRKAQGYINELAKVTNVAGQIQSFYQRWQQLTSQEARSLLARAVVDKVRKAGREKATAEKAWYQELLRFLEGQKG